MKERAAAVRSGIQSGVIAGVCMGILSRIGVALDSDLLKQFDHWMNRRGYTNRSEAFRDLIRDRLVGERTSSPN
ncbi:MAG: ribbon-helix-helix protein, CopG family, partial [Terracidiphilus sp.]